VQLRQKENEKGSTGAEAVFFTCSHFATASVWRQIQKRKSAGGAAFIVCFDFVFCCWKASVVSRNMPQETTAIAGARREEPLGRHEGELDGGRMRGHRAAEHPEFLRGHHYRRSPDQSASTPPRYPEGEPDASISRGGRPTFYASRHSFVDGVSPETAPYASTSAGRRPFTHNPQGPSYHGGYRPEQMMGIAHTSSYSSYMALTSTVPIKASGCTCKKSRYVHYIMCNELHICNWLDPSLIIA